MINELIDSINTSSRSESRFLFWRKQSSLKDQQLNEQTTKVIVSKCNEIPVALKSVVNVYEKTIKTAVQLSWKRFFIALNIKRGTVQEICHVLGSKMDKDENWRLKSGLDDLTCRSEETEQIETKVNERNERSSTFGSSSQLILTRHSFLSVN